MHGFRFIEFLLILYICYFTEWNWCRLIIDMPLGHECWYTNYCSRETKCLLRLCALTRKFSKFSVNFYSISIQLSQFGSIRQQ